MTASRDAGDIKTSIEVGLPWLLIAVLLRHDLAPLRDACVERSLSDRVGRL